MPQTHFTRDFSSPLLIFGGFIAAGISFYFALVSSERPFLDIDNVQYDFGKVTQGSVLSYNLRLSNTTSLPIHIASVKGSCSCTTTRVDDQEIAPGAHLIITISWDVGGRRLHSTAENIIEYYVGTHKQPLLRVARATAYVIPTFVAVPDRIKFPRNKTSTQLLTIHRNAVASRSRLTNVIASHPCIKPRLVEQFGPNGVCIVEVSCEPFLCDPHLQESFRIVVKTDNAIEPELSIPVQIN